MLDLDGSADKMTAPSGAVNLNTGTFSAWVRPDIASGTDTPFYFFDTTTSRHAFYHRSDTVSIEMYNDGKVADWNDGNPSWSAGELFHIALLYNKTGGVQRLFFNGVEKTPDTTSGSWGGSAIGTLHMGSRFGSTEFFEGDFGEVATYNAVISDAEVVALANGFSPLMVATDSLISYWKFIRDSGVPAFGNLAATIVSAPPVTVHDPGILYLAPPFISYPVAAAGVNAPTGHLLGPLYGPMGGPIAV